MNNDKLQVQADGKMWDFDVTCLARDWWDQYFDLVKEGIDYCIGDGTFFSYQGYIVQTENGEYKIFGSDGIIHIVPGDTVIYIKFDDLTRMQGKLKRIEEAIKREKEKTNESK